MHTTEPVNRIASGSPSPAGHEAVDQFVARVLRRAHETAQARDEPSAERTILHVARLFADELTAGEPGFDRAGFVTAATEGPR